MVGFDGGSGSGTGFYHVRIQGALDKELHILQFIGFFLEGMDKFSTNGLTLLSGSVTPFRRDMKCLDASM